MKIKCSGYSLHIFPFIIWLAVMLISGFYSAWARCSGTSIFARDVCSTGAEPCCLTSSAFGYGVCNVTCDNVWVNGNLTCVATGVPSFTSNSCGVNPIPTSSRVSALCCDNQCEVDSVICVRDGKEWTMISGGTCNGKGCKECPNDTTWTEIQCAYSPSKGLYLNVVNTYGIKNCEAFSRSTQYYSTKCDSVPEDSVYKCIGSVDGENVHMQAPWGATFSCKADGSCSRAQQMIANGECETPKRPQSSSSGSTGSSDSEGGSSDSEGGSSDSEGGSSDSEGGSSDSEGGSSDSEGGSSSSGAWGWLADSLGQIDENIKFLHPYVTGIYDGVNEANGNLYDVKQNQRNLQTTASSLLDVVNIQSTWLQNTSEKADLLSTQQNHTNSILESIKNKTTDLTGIQNRQDQTRDSLHNTNTLLEQIKNLLGKSDTIHIDTSKAPASIDSSLKFWGDRNNRNFGSAGLDSSGWGQINDEATAAGDSALQASSWLLSIGCDTTGGRKCDNSIIGSNGLDSATSRLKAGYRELGDSLTGGVFGDSLAVWGGKFTGNGILAGSGSASCPSVLTKNYRVQIIGDTGFDIQIGYYLCQPIFGNVTAWALCRLLLRASVALACMWFLFKCATGFKGQGGEDE